MIEHNIKKLWEDSTEETGLLTYHIGYIVEANVESYPCMLLYSNNWDDQDHIDAVKPADRYMIDGTVALRIYSDKQLDVIKGYPIWRNRASQINAVGGGSTAPGGLPNTNLPGGIPINPRGGGGNVNVVNIVLQPGLSNTGQVLLRVIKNADSRNVRITGAGVLP